MSTSHSPLRKLKAEADRIAAQLKALDRGDHGAHDPAGKIAAAKALDTITFGVVMDDKVLKLDMPWKLIRETSETGLSEWIIKHMRGQREAAH